MSVDILAWLAIAGNMVTLAWLVYYLPRKREWMLAIIPFIMTPSLALAVGVLSGALVHHHV